MTAKPKKVASKELALTKHDPELMQGIVAIVNLATPFGEAAEANVTIENLDKAVEVLARVREANRKLEEVGKVATADLRKKIKPFDTERLALAKKLTAADKSVADQMVILYNSLDGEGRAAVDKKLAGALGSTATFVHRGYEVTVTDADLVPDEYIMEPPPRSARVNTAAIEAIITAGLKPPPGVSVKRKVSITTRAADTIKKVAAK